MKKEFILNLIANLLTFVATTFIGLWLTPFIRNTLGAESYGYIPLVQNLINYMTTITVILNSMASRFFTYSMKQNRLDDAVEYVNTSLYSGLVMCAGLLVLVAGMVFKIDSIIAVRPADLADVKLLMIFVGIGFVIATGSSVFGTAAYCRNKVYVNSLINMGGAFVRVIFTVGLMMLFPPVIWFVSLANLMSTIGMASAKFISFKKLMPHIKFKRKFFNGMKLKELLSSGAWNAINQLGSMLFLQIDLLVANRVFPLDKAGDYAAVLQWSTFLRSFAVTVVGVFGPTIVALYAQGKMKEMVDYNNKSIRIVGMFIVLPIAIICGLGGSLLSIWLGPDMEKYKWLLMLMTLHLSVNLAVSPIFQVQTACNKVRTPAIVTIILGGINLLLAIYFSKYTSIGIYGIALAGAIVLTGKNLLFTPVYNAIITGQKPFAYVKGVIPVAITTVLMSGIAYAMDYFLVIDSFIKLVGAAVVVAVIYLPVAWFGMLKKAERAEAIKSVKKRLKKA